MNDTRPSDGRRRCRGQCDSQWLTHDDPLCPLYEGDMPAVEDEAVTDEDLMPRRQKTSKKLHAA